MLAFHSIPQHWNVAYRRISTLYTVDIMAADDLAMQGARATAAMVLTLFSQNIPVSVSAGLSSLCASLVSIRPVAWWSSQWKLKFTRIQMVIICQYWQWWKVGVWFWHWGMICSEYSRVSNRKVQITSPCIKMSCCNDCWLTHWGCNKMAAIFADDIFKCFFMNENCILIQLSLKLFQRAQLIICQHWFG